MKRFESQGLSDSDSDQVDSEENDLDPTDGGSDASYHPGFGGGGQPPSKKAKTGTAQDASASLYSSFANKMMQKMGYEKGKGLGKYGQGRAEIVEASKQRGRRGLGLTLRGFEATSVEWESEEISAEEHVDWLPECKQDIPSLEEMSTWMTIGKKKRTIDDETMFCDAEILSSVLNSKSIFDDLEPEEMRRARTRSNPFETIRGAIFLNRAAMKMANMDAVLDFMFTDPRDEYGKSLVLPNELLYFVDVCAGPGGFSEYVLWRKKADTKGFGFTLKGENDFKLTEFFTGPSENFEPHYGVGGVEGDGDIFKPDNLVAFRKFVLENTDGKGVHFVMGDGGFSVEGQENIQEILSKQLYLCQFLAALSVLRPGGHFVCKLFDIFTPFSVGLVYLMYRVFKQVAIFKPVTSRPANSERYIICKWLRDGADPVHDYFFNVNQTLNQFGVMSTEDVNEVIPRNLLFEEEFFSYILESNNLLGRVQALNLAKIQAFTQDTDLYEERQSEMRTQCLYIWKVPDEVRTAPSKPDPGVKFKELTQKEDCSYFNHMPTRFLPATLESIKSVYDYRCMLSGSDHRWFLMSFGRTHIFKWDGRPGHRWQKMDDVKLELPSDTLIEAEFVQELRGEGKGQRRLTAVHVLDAVVLYGVDVRNEHFNARMERLVKLAKAVTKTSRQDLAPIRAKHVFRFEEIDKVFQKIQSRVVKGSGGRPVLCYSHLEQQYFVPKGVYFIKTVEDPWLMAFSKSQQRKYWYNVITHQSTFELPPDSIANVRSCILNRLVWEWQDGTRILDSQPRGHSDSVSREDIELFLSNKLSFQRN